MTQILNKNDVNYLSTKLEYDQLFEDNTGIIETVDNFIFPPNQFYPLQYHRTGNGLIHLQALLACNADFTNPNANLTVNPYPSFLLPSTNFLYVPAIIITNGGNFVNAMFSVTVGSVQLSLFTPNSISQGSNLLINYSYLIRKNGPFSPI